MAAKNDILIDKDGNQIFPATMAEQVSYDGKINVKQAIKRGAVRNKVAPTVASMTDNEQIYVYTGTEDGYTFGNWYYWDGTAWTSGGAYNAIEVNTDGTLTEEGAPADAKATGDKLIELKGDLACITGNEVITGFINNKFINTSGSTTNYELIDSDSNWSCVTVDCAEGDVFVLTGTGGNNARLWAFCDDNGNITRRSGAGATLSDFEFHVKSGETKFVVNLSPSGGRLVKNKYLASVVNNLTSDLEELKNFDTKVSEIKYMRYESIQKNYLFAYASNIKKDTIIYISGLENIKFGVRDNDYDGAYLKIDSDARWHTDSDYDRVFFEIKKTDNTDLTDDEINNVKIYALSSAYDADIKAIKNNFADDFVGDIIVVDDSLSDDDVLNTIPQVDCTIKSIGKNLFNYKTAKFGTIHSQTGLYDDSWLGGIVNEEYIPVLPNTDYSLHTKQYGFYYRLAIYDENKNFIERIETNIRGSGFGTLTTPSNAKYARFAYTLQAGAEQPSISIESCKIMLYKGDTVQEFEDYESNEVTIVDGVADGSLSTYYGCTTIHDGYGIDLSVKSATSVINLIKNYNKEDIGIAYSDDECRERFRVEMREKAKRIGMSNTVVGDGAGHPVQSQITVMDSIKMLVHAMGYKKISETWTYDNKIIRTKGKETTINIGSTLFTNSYNSELTDYYTVLGFKTGSGSTHNLVCACTSPSLYGKVLVGCMVLGQANDTDDINIYKAMKILMDLGLAKYNNRDADVSSYVNELTNNLTAMHFGVVLLPDCNNTSLLNRWNFENDFSLLYKSSDSIFTSWSTIKLMCAMTALDYVDDLDEKFEVIESDLLFGTGAYGLIFNGGEIITIRQALDILLIASSNQAAYFLERVIGKKILEKYGSDGFLPTN